MKKLGIHIFICFMVILACVACTTDTLPENSVPCNENFRIPLSIKVNNIVDITTRGAVMDLPGDRLSADTRLGLFVMYERDYDSLAIGSNYHNISYFYDNVECFVDNSGVLQTVSGEQMYYPMGRGSKIALFAYAPYDSTMTRERLLNPKDKVSVAKVQNNEETLLANDLLLGTPVLGNPLPRPNVSGWQGGNNVGDIQLKLRHQRCRIVLNFTLQGLFELIGTEPPAHVDSLAVYAENIPVEAKCGYSLESTMTDFSTSDSIRRDTVLMGTFLNVENSANENQAYTSACIAIPCNEAAEISFKLMMKSGTEINEVRLYTKAPVVFERGTSVLFHVNTDTGNESNTELDDVSIDPMNTGVCQFSIEKTPVLSREN